MRAKEVTVMMWHVDDDLNQESEQNEVDGMKKGADKVKVMHIKSNLFEDTINGVKQDFKAGKPALTEALNTIKDGTKQHQIQKLNELYGNICKWTQYTIIKLMIFHWCERAVGDL